MIDKNTPFYDGSFSFKEPAPVLDNIIDDIKKNIPRKTKSNKCENVTSPPLIVLDKTLEKELLRILETWQDRVNCLEIVHGNDNPPSNAVRMCQNDIRGLLYKIEDGKI